MRLKSYLLSLIPMAFTATTSYWVLGRTPNPNLTHYLQSAFALATIVALPGGVIYGIFGAWRSANIHSALQFVQNSKRSRMTIIRNEIEPLVVTFVASYLLVLVGNLVMAAATADPVPWLLLTLIPSISISIIAFGFLCGLVFPRVLGLIAASLIPLIWSGFTVASPVFALHYATGLLYPNCCRIYQVIEPSSLALTIVTNLTFALLCIAISFRLLSSRDSNSIRAWIVAAASAATLITSFLTLGSHIAPTPISERNRNELTCSNQKPEICSFPKQIQSSEITKALRSSWKSLHEIYPEIPKRIVGTVPELGEVGVVITTSSTPSEVAYSLAADTLGSPAYCNESIADQEIRDSNYRILQNLFLDAIASPELDSSQWKSPLTKQETDTLIAIDSMPIELKQTWITTKIKAVHDCNSKPAMK